MSGGAEGQTAGGAAQAGAAPQAGGMQQAAVRWAAREQPGRQLQPGSRVCQGEEDEVDELEDPGEAAPALAQDAVHGAVEAAVLGVTHAAGGRAGSGDEAVGWVGLAAGGDWRCVQGMACSAGAGGLQAFQPSTRSAHRYTSASMREVHRDTRKKMKSSRGPAIQPHQATALGRPAGRVGRGKEDQAGALRHQRGWGSAGDSWRWRAAAEAAATQRRELPSPLPQVCKLTQHASADNSAENVTF